MKIFKLKMTEAGLQLFIKWMRKAPVEEVEDFLNDIRGQVRAQLPQPKAPKGLSDIPKGVAEAAKEEAALAKRPPKANGSASRYAKVPQ